MVFNENLPETLAEYLKSTKYFVETYSHLKGHTTFVFKLTDEVTAGVIPAFLDGKYSEIDRSYVNKHFPDNPAHRLYGNRLVLIKHPAKRSFWESRIGVSLPPDAEVFPRPTKKSEIYGFIANNEDLSPDPTVADWELNHNDTTDQELREALS